MGVDLRPCSRCGDEVDPRELDDEARCASCRVIGASAPRPRVLIRYEAGGPDIGGVIDAGPEARIWIRGPTIDYQLPANVTRIEIVEVET